MLDRASTQLDPPDQLPIRVLGKIVFEVLTVSFYSKEPVDIVSPSNRAVVSQITAYWEALRSGRDAPYRSEVDPRGIQSALKNAFILERMAPGLAKIRVSCRQLTELMGMDMRGMPITSMITPDSRESFRRTIEDVFTGPAVGELRLRGDKGFLKPGPEAHMLLLPLKDEAGDVTRILGAFTNEGCSGPKSHQFRLEGSFLRQLGEIKNKGQFLRPIRENDGRTFDVPQTETAEASRNANFSEMTRATRHRHLRVVLNEED